jgi:hypothetical protein
VRNLKTVLSRLHKVDGDLIEIDKPKLRSTLEQLRTELPAADFDAAVEASHSLNFERAVEDALHLT